MHLSSSCKLSELVVFLFFFYLNVFVLLKRSLMPQRFFIPESGEDHHQKGPTLQMFICQKAISLNLVTLTTCNHL